MGIYALCDIELLKRFDLSLEEFVKIAKLFKASILQYRDKNGILEEKLENIKKLRYLWDEVLIVNDELSLARLCDGLHIGQEDLEEIKTVFGTKDKKEALVVIKKVANAKIVGLSTHSLEEIEEANRLELDYIGLGAYRNSSTKKVNYLLGDELPKLASFSLHKVVAIGGVRVFDNIPNVWKKAIGSDLIVKALTYG
ncbi:MAG: thiamine phosphate synthase [Epsilonproteobacteria bacterium]|nr:thiamine phosphate synthase [Campylobacterota bacterium]